MDFVKQYIVQSIAAASNSLRLTSNKIEVVALLREIILTSNDLENDIREMKKNTLLSTFAIRLHEIYNFLMQGNFDFFKISDKIKEHSRLLIKDLSHLLEQASPSIIQSIADKIKDKSKLTSIEAKVEKTIELPHAPIVSIVEINETTAPKIEVAAPKDVSIKDINTNPKFELETIFLNTIKETEPVLLNITPDMINTAEIMKYASMLESNANLAFKNDLGIIGKMFRTASKGLLKITDRSLEPNKDTIDCVRACIIVAAAMIKGKDIDITNFINKAEAFGGKVLN